jgi:phage-related protein
MGIFKPRILIFYGDYFWDVFDTLNKESQEKFNRILRLISTTDNISKSIFKHVTDSRGLFEIRIETLTGRYRVFCFFDRNNRLIIINGFLKKSANTPRKELQKAFRIRKEYYINVIDSN